MHVSLAAGITPYPPPYSPCNHHTDVQVHSVGRLPNTHSLPHLPYRTLPPKGEKLTFPDSIASRGDHVTLFGLNQKLICLEALLKNICLLEKNKAHWERGFSTSPPPILALDAVFIHASWCGRPTLETQEKSQDNNGMPQLQALTSGVAKSLISKPFVS